MIKIKDPDHGHADHIWVIDIDFGDISLTTHHIKEIEIGDYAYPKTGTGLVTIYHPSELSDSDLLEAYMGVSDRYGICTVREVIPW
ncbi:hypothetical protein ACQZ45_25585 [Agrobacterium sp. 16-2014-1-2a]